MQLPLVSKLHISAFTFLTPALSTFRPSTYPPTCRTTCPVLTCSGARQSQPAKHPKSSQHAQTAPLLRNLDIVLCHATADFDSLAAAVGLAKLRGPQCRVVIPAGVHDAVRRYLSLHKSFFPFLDPKAVDPQRLRWVGVVDANESKRLGPTAAAWLEHAQSVTVMDHHQDAEKGDIITNARPGQASLIYAPVGAVSTLVVEQLITRPDLALSQAESTLLALAIHTDTGSLTYENTTPRDASALAWLLAQGACQRSISQFSRNYLSPEQQRLLSLALDTMEIRSVDGLKVASVVLESEFFVKGMSSVAQAAMELANMDALLLAILSPSSRRARRSAKANEAVKPSAAPTTKQVSLIGRARSRVDGINYNDLFEPYGGGGHAKAASASIKMASSLETQTLVDNLVSGIVDQLPPPILAGDFMSTNVVSVSPSETMEDARKLLETTGHTGLAVVTSEESEELVGVISRQDVALAERRGILQTRVKGWVAREVIYVSPCTPLHVVEEKLVDNNIGRLPVVDNGHVVGIITRSDVLVQRRLWSSSEHM